MAKAQYDVIVIGGGISGLTAAYTLRKKMPDAKVMVLEGKDRVGGRTQTVPLISDKGTDRWDLGGQWVGKCQPHVMRLLDDLDLETYPQYTAGQKLQQLGGSKVTSYSSDIPSLSFWALIDLYWHMAKTEKYQRQIDVTDPFSHPKAKEWDAMSLASFLDQSLYTRGALEAIEAAVRVIFGCEPSQISTLFFLVYVHMAGGLEALLEAKEGMAQEARVKGGAQQISIELAKRLSDDNLRLGDPVRSIHQTGDGVEVRTQEGWQGNTSYVIMATPPKAMEEVNFEPSLSPVRRNLMKRMPMGSLIKIIITFQTAFWREAGLSGEVVSNGGSSGQASCPQGPVCLCYDAASEHGSPALVAFVGGNMAVSFAGMKAKNRQEAVLKQLSLFFGPQVHKFLDYVEKDWDLESLSWGGPVSYVGPGGMHLFAATVRRPEGRVHFAGTEAATRWSGYMSGAVQAGEASALAVLHRLNPGCLSPDDMELMAPFAHQEEHRGDQECGDRALSFLHRDTKSYRGLGRWVLSTGLVLAAVAGTAYLVGHFVRKGEVEVSW